MSRTRPVRVKPEPGPHWYPPEIDPPKPDVTRRTTAGWETREVTVSSKKGRLPIVYGSPPPFAGDVRYTFRSGPTADDIWVVVELCQGEIDSLVQGTINGAALNLYANLEFWFYTGTAGQTVNANLAAVDPSWNEALPNVCYAILHFLNISRVWPEFPEVLWRIKGRKCFDVRTGLTVYTTNTVLQWHDYLKLPQGKALPSSRIKDSTVITAANVADEPVGSEKRYESHILMESGDVDDWIKIFRLLCNAWLPFTANQFHMILDRPGSTVASYGDSTHQRQSESAERNDPTEKINSVIVKYSDPSNNFELTPMPALETAAVIAGTEERRQAVLDLPWIQSRSMARRAQVYYLNRLVHDFKLRVSHLGMTADRTVGELINKSVDSRSIANQPFRLMSRGKRENNTFADVLLVYDTSVYSDETVSSSSRVNSTAPDPFATPPAPTGLTAVDEQKEVQLGLRLPFVKITWTRPAYIYSGGTIIKYQRGSDPVATLGVFDGEGPVYLRITDDQSSYQFWAHTINRFTKVESAAATALLIRSTPSPFEPPAPPTNVRITADGNGLYWDAPKQRIQQLWASTWSQTGVTGFSAAAINDGVKNVSAGSAAEFATITLDTGTPKSFAFAVIHTDVAANQSQEAYKIEHSSDGTNFTNVAGFITLPVAIGGGWYRRERHWTPPGAFRYWRLTLSAASLIAELQFQEQGADWPHVREYRVYKHNAGAPPKLFTVIPANKLPTVNDPYAMPVLRITDSTVLATTYNTDPYLSYTISKTDGSSIGATAFRVSAIASGSTPSATYESDFIFRSLFAVAQTSGAEFDKPLSLFQDLSYVKGDLLVFGGTKFNRLAVGANGKVLVADSTAAEGVKWGEAMQGGEAMQAVNAVNPTTATISGYQSSTSAPQGAHSVSVFTTTSATLVTVASVTGKGVLRYLSFGNNITQTSNIKVTVDGVVIWNDIASPAAGSGSNGFAVALVGSFAVAKDGTSHFWTAQPSEQGIEFKTSLLIEARIGTGGTAHVLYSYKLYA